MTLLPTTASCVALRLAAIDPRVTGHPARAQHGPHRDVQRRTRSRPGRVRRTSLGGRSTDSGVTGTSRRGAGQQPTVGLVYGHPVVFYDTVPPAHARSARYRVWKGADWISCAVPKGSEHHLLPRGCTFGRLCNARSVAMPLAFLTRRTSRCGSASLQSLISPASTAVIKRTGEFTATP